MISPAVNRKWGKAKVSLLIQEQDRVPVTYREVMKRLSERVRQAQAGEIYVGRGRTDFYVSDVDAVLAACIKADAQIRSLKDEIAELRAQLKVIEPTAPSDMRPEPRKATPQKVVVSDETLAVMRSLNQGYEVPVWLTVRQYAEAYKVTVDQVNGYRRRKHNALPSRKLPGVPWQVMDVPY